MPAMCASLDCTRALSTISRRSRQNFAPGGRTVARGRRAPLRGGIALEPALLAVPVGRLAETLDRLDSGLPKLRRAGALGLDHPITVGEIGGAVGGKLGPLPAPPLIEVRRGSEEDAGRGKDRRPGADRGGQRSRELALGPAAG